MNVGFIHGVMNTDNMTISGETIDYGPCAFMEAYDPAAVFSSIDHQGRYAFGNQPNIARWNLARLAESLLPLLADDEEQATAEAMRVIDAFPALYRRHLLSGQRAKLGLQRVDGADDAADATLADDWLAVLHAGHVDFTLAWRRLADAAAGDDAPLRALFGGRRRERARRVARALARALRARRRRHVTRRNRRGRRARRAHAPRQPVGDPAQPSRRGSARRRLRRRRPRPVRSPARRLAPSRTTRPPTTPATPSRPRPTSPPCYRTFCGT